MKVKKQEINKTKTSPFIEKKQGIKLYFATNL